MADLAHVLRQLPPVHDPNLLAGENLADDAAVYRLTDELALVQTVDFFTPIVDDPYLYGRIAAANSLSDVYAMGGTPLTALNVVGFPVKTVSMDVLGEILRGGSELAAEAGVTIVGGHTVDDEEPKYGLAVTGTVHPARFLSPRGARPGDRLFLTKPVGTGVISTALKAGEADQRDVDQAVFWMTTLNRSAGNAAREASATAVTDVTGFGLLGHLVQLCLASKVAARLSAAAVPLLPGALGYARAGFSPGGTATNLDFVQPYVNASRVDDTTLKLLADPQTSGGLIVAVPPERSASFRAAAREDMLTVELGEIVDGPAGGVEVLS